MSFPERVPTLAANSVFSKDTNLNASSPKEPVSSVIMRQRRICKGTGTWDLATVHSGVWTLALACLLLSGCKPKESASRDAAEAPPTVPAVVPIGQPNQVQVGNASQFPLVPVAARSTFSSLNVTGQVQPDPAHEVPVLSIANGRVTALRVDVGDTVRKGQLVMDVQSPDVAGAFNIRISRGTGFPTP